MALIAPFRGLRYNPDRIDNMEEVVTPPYDVIDEKAHAALIRKNPYNMVQLDLSKHFEQNVPLDERYARARNLFEQWQAEEILIRDRVPAIYLYDTEYVHPSGRRLTRRGFVCLVQLAEFAEGIVKPHEKTFKEFTTDRLRLLDTWQSSPHSRRYRAFRPAKNPGTAGREVSLYRRWPPPVYNSPAIP